MRSLLLGTVLVALALPASEALAQTRPALPVAPQQAEPEDDRAAARFRLADSYLRAEQPDRAIPLLEDLLADDPTSFPVYDRLRDAYVAARRPADAVRLVEDRIRRLGASAQLFAELGSLHAADGRLDDARAAWRRAVDAAPNQTQTYRTLYAVMVQQRFWEDARDALLDGRRRLRQNDLFRVELADLYARADGYAEALEEWAAFLAEDEQRLGFVQGRMSRLLDQDGAAEAFRAALDRLIRREPTRLPLRRLAAWMAAESGDFDAGLDHTRALDRLARESGESLYAFAETALQARALGPALRAFDLVLENHPDAPVAALALLSSALVFEREAEQARERAEGAHYAEARARYRRFLERHAAHASAPLATERLARLERDVFADFGTAERLLTELLARIPPGGEPAARARLALAELALLQDDLPRARSAFSQVDADLRTGTLAERARIELARLDFFEGNFEMAEARASAMKLNTASDAANDALALRLLITENGGPDERATPLRLYAEADLRLRQQRTEESLALIDQLLASYGGHAIADDATFRRAEILRHLDRTDEALDLLRTLPERFPLSYLTDRALFLAAEILERDVRDDAAAIATYVELLTRHPGSLLAPETRTRLRALRGDRPSS